MPLSIATNHFKMPKCQVIRVVPGFNSELIIQKRNFWLVIGILKILIIIFRSFQYDWIDFKEHRGAWFLVCPGTEPVNEDRTRILSPSTKDTAGLLRKIKRYVFNTNT